MAQLSENLVRGAIRSIREDLKLILTINEVDQALHAWLSFHSGDSVAIPKNEAQAELMAKMGIAWLEQHAPHRLKGSQVQQKGNEDAP